MKFFFSILILFLTSSAFGSSIAQDSPIYQVRYISEDQVLTGDQDGILKLWDVKSSKLLWKSAPLGGAIFSMDVRGDSFALGLGADKKSFVIGELVKGRPVIKKLMDMRGPVQVSFSSDASLVAAGSGNGVSRVFELSSLKLKYEAKNEFATSVLRFLPNAKSFLQARDAVHDGSPQAQWQKASLDLVNLDQDFNQDSAIEVEAESILGLEASENILVVRSYMGRFGHRAHSHHTQLSILALDKVNEPAKELHYGQFVNDVAIAKDRMFLALDDGDVEIISIQGQELGLIGGEGESIMDVELSPSRKSIAIADFGGQLRFVDL